MILASASPRRRELLEAAGFSLEVLPAEVDETRLPNEAPVAYVARLARKKAHAARAKRASLPQGEALIAADTIVHRGNDASSVTLGKPKDDRDAASMLHMLSGITHQVSTGVCVLVGADGTTREHVFVETSDVTFFDLCDADIDAYISSGEPRDKAGAYGIQAKGRLLVRAIAGSYDNIVGLPVAQVVRTLAQLGYGTGDALLGALLGQRAI